MEIVRIFAADKLNINPEITGIFLWMTVILVVGGILLLIKEVLVQIFASRKLQDKADRNIWFDSVKSVLHRNHRQANIPDNSLEYFVCKLVFEEIDKPQLDLNVLEAAGRRDDDDPRSVEQAVRRVNKKARNALELKNDLLLRSKEKTFINEIDHLV